MTPLPLPDYLSDLQFSLGDMALALHPVSWEDGMYAIDLKAPKDSWGLFVNLERECGKHHDSQTVEEYREGCVYCHVRSLHDHVGTPREFSDWLRERVTKLFHKLVRSHIEGAYDRLDRSSGKDKAHVVAALSRPLSLHKWQI